MTPPAPTPLSRLRAALVDDLLDRWPRDPHSAPMLAAWEADRMAPRIGRALSSAGLVLADAVPDGQCTWTQDDNGVWHTSCDNAFEIDCDTPSSHGMEFCCYCGKTLREARDNG